MRQWWNKLPMYEKEGQRRASVVFNPTLRLDSRGRAGQDDPGDDDDDTPPRRTPIKKGDEEFEEITVEGKKFKVQKGMGELINKLTGKGTKTSVQDQAALLKMMESMLDERIPKKGTKKKAAPVDDDDDDDEDDDSELFTDPKAWKKKFAESIRKQVLNEVQGAYSADQGQRTFWQNFYTRNEDLQDYDFIVKAVLQQNMDELKVMEVREASKKLSELVREKLIDIAKKTGKGKANKNGTHVEGSGEARRGRNLDNEEDVDQNEADEKAGMAMTLGAMLKKRREERRSKRTGQAEE